MKQRIPVIVGPTCSGKTGLGIDLCKKLDGEIISADSRQVYKHMDVGTGKIPSHKIVSYEKNDGFWMLEGVKVWGYDVVSPGEFFSAYDFALYGLYRARGILDSGKAPLLVGGTGLYVDFFTGIIKGDRRPPDLLLRKKLQIKDLPELQEMVTSLNLDINKSDFSNKRRLVRILERETTTKKKQPPLPHFPLTSFIFIGLRSDRKNLYSRTDSWVDSIWENGALIDEVEFLKSMGSVDARQLKGIIYSEALAFMEGSISRDEAMQKTKHSVHAYIRRQQTYFKRNEAIRWFDIDQENLFERVYNYIEDQRDG
jgi:tRNA dimethylallyltransferase